MVTQQVDPVPNQHRLTAADKFGPFLIGIFINMILYGALAMQVLTYFQTYKKDRWIVKAFIYYLFALETLNTGLDMYIIYEPLIINYGTEVAHSHFPAALASEPIIIGLVGTPVQFFIAYRIRVITQSVYIPAAICVLSLASLAGSFWAGAMLAAKVAMFETQSRLRSAVLLWLLAAAVSDILLTGTLVQALYKKKNGAFKAMDTILNRIIILTVQTGMATALAAVIDVIFFMAMPHTSINYVFGLTLSKLYVNCIMSTLNARNGWNSALASGHNEPNFLWDSEGVDEKGEVLVFANPKTSANIETGLRSSTLSHRPRLYEPGIDTMPHNGTRPFASGELSIGIDRSAETLHDLPLLQKPQAVQSRNGRHFYQGSL